MPTDILWVFVAPGELPQVVNAEAERSRVERYPSHGFLAAMFDGAIDRLVKVADKVWLYRLHSDDDELAQRLDSSSLAKASSRWMDSDVIQMFAKE